ncbi:Transketolase, thiamine diphosphate binding domain-containing protein [Mycena maculata]|uniref:Transketolase, thiamine diphosphate binding domain-containing protein n=1 Tax=Mycena maculata TaxID=230809 RepID=A0AAD7MXU0_9AGAR|nr:Transketolase, thiamine diphosphate binding domain-containing protein [Mycena maculata]
MAPQNGHSNGHAASDTEKLVLNTVRILGADLTQAFKGGHPGTVMGAAAIGFALWRHVMSYNPKNPDWFDRDRFVLSAGHACLWQYIYLHLTGYEAWTIDALRQYHNPKFGIAAGHPEIEFPGIELTTGLLGQGIANAVGLAMASKNLAATYNRPGFDIVDNKIWCFSGDGCLQEGVGQEALSLAGHLRLDNLIIVYDDNSITVDGRIENCFTDATSAKMESIGFHVLEVYDGTNDLHAIISALEKAKTIKGKPTFVHVRTTIGFGSRKANTGSAHGAALGEDEVEYVKTSFGFDPKAKFVIPEEVYDYFRPVVQRGADDEKAWTALYAQYKDAHPAEYAEIEQRLTGDLPAGWREFLPPKSALPTAPQATRKSSGIAAAALFPKYKNFMVGSADLMESTFVHWKGQVEFQNPETGLGDYSGRQIRYGIREFAMIGISNGMNAYQNGMIIPVCSSYFQFWLYAASGVRMTALQGLRFIGIGTHDSIGVGEDGPTHQSIALGTFFRALPNMNFIRPADAEEVLGAWEVALDSPHTPSIFATTRQEVPLLAGSDRSKVKLGAYPIFSMTPDDAAPELVIIATGSEVYRAIEAAKKLAASLRVRVVSMPSQSHFDKQPAAYRRFVLASGTALAVAIESWGGYGWAKYAHASFSMHTFGLSAPQATLFDLFGFGVDTIVEKIGAFAESRRVGGKIVLPPVGEFEELLLGYAKQHAGPHTV